MAPPERGLAPTVESGNEGCGQVTDQEQQELQDWRAAMLSDLRGPDITAATRALLALTYDDPDRTAVESLLLRQLSSSEVDPEVRALAVTCMGHVGRIHRAVSPEVVRRLESLIDDPELGGRAEDALGDIAAFGAAN